VDDIKEIKTELYNLKRKANRRKRALKSINDKIRLYMSVADAAISDAARWKIQAEVWKERYERVVEDNNGKDS